MRHPLRFLSLVLVAVVTWAATLSDVVTAQPRGEEIQPPRDEHPMKQLWRKADESQHHIQLIHIYTKYCKPPEEPNIETTQWEIDFEQENLNTLANEFATLEAAYLNSFSTPLGASFRAGFPPFDGYTPFQSEYWAKTRGLLTRNQNLLNAKQEALNKKKEEDCSGKKKTTAPPPPPPSTDPGIRLPALTVRPVEIPSSPKRFCSNAEKQAAIYNLTKVGFDFYLNFQNAQEYHDTIAEALARGQGNADVLRRMLPDAKKNLDFHKARHDEYERELARVRAMPVEDCGEPPPPSPPDAATPIPLPDYEYFVWPAVPDRFCSEEEKQAVLSQLETAEAVARDNRMKAKAHKEVLQQRLDAGDRTPGLPEAKENARQAESAFHAAEIARDREYAQAQAMPVEKCGGVTTGARAGAEAGAPTGVTPGAEAGAQMGTRAATGKEIGFNFSGGFKQTDTPQTWIGRIVVAGEDTALARTPDTLEGYFAGAYIEVMKMSGEPLFGDSASLGVLMHFSSVEGDQTALVDTPAGGATGYVFIDPTDPTRPVGGTGIATGFGSWDTRTSADQRTFDVAAMYRESLGRDVSLGAGVFVRAQDTELSGWQSHLGVPGLTANERYDISTVDVGAMFEALLRREPSRGVFVEASAFVAPTIASRDYEAVQRTTAPAPFSFDYTQRRDFDDDGFNLLYGVNASIGIEVADGYRLSLIAGWQGETDAPTVRPADGSAPGAPIGPDTESASEWHVGLKLGGPLN